MNLHIRKIAILGSGTMGAQIACLFANVGQQVLLLDRVPDNLTPQEKEKGLSRNDERVRNRIAREGLTDALALKPPPIYHPSLAERIETGNFENDFVKLSECDWIIEAVTEDLSKKQALLERIERYRKKGCIVSTNTSRFTIAELAMGRTEDFRRHFCGTHFLNQPRYVQLLEIIPLEETDPEVTDCLMNFGDHKLGKTTMLCKDSPGFIANRIGIYAFMLTIELMREMDLSIEEIDALTGVAMGRTRKGTFRRADLRGLDVLTGVSKEMYRRLEKDEERNVFKLPEFVEKMLQHGWTGNKVNAGFYKKEKEKGKTKLYALEPDTMEYRPKRDPKFLLVEDQKKKRSLKDRLRSFEGGEVTNTNLLKKAWLKLSGAPDHKATEFFRRFHYRFLAYCSRRVPEIAADFYKLDRAMEAGSGWKAGPFRMWDMLGVRETRRKIEEMGFSVAPWVDDMLAAGFESFYTRENGELKCYDISSGQMKVVPGLADLVRLDNYREDHTIWRNGSLHIIHIGEGVLVAEMRSHRNLINREVMEGIDKAIDLAETDPRFKAVIIGNGSKDLTYGADIATIGKYALLQKKGAIRKAVEQFQGLNMRIRYSGVPVVLAVQGRCFGGGCEMGLHADRVQAAAESLIGLPEVGAGLIPAGGGVAQMARRATLEMSAHEPPADRIRPYFTNIAMAEIAKSPEEAFRYGYLRRGIDRISMNRKRVLTDAKVMALELAADYTPPSREACIRALGQNGLEHFHSTIDRMHSDKTITDYDRIILRKLAYVFCGGELSGEQMVKEEYIMELERDAFVQLLGKYKTLDRIASLVFKGKPKKN